MTMLSLVTVAAIFLACLPPETVSQQCRSGVTDEIRQSVREQLRQGGGNGTIPTVAVNCGQVRLAAKCGSVLYAALQKLNCSQVCSFAMCCQVCCTSMIPSLPASSLLIIHSMHATFFFYFSTDSYHRLEKIFVVSRCNFWGQKLLRCSTVLM